MYRLIEGVLQHSLISYGFEKCRLVFYGLFDLIRTTIKRRIPLLSLGSESETMDYLRPQSLP